MTYGYGLTWLLVWPVVIVCSNGHGLWPIYSIVHPSNICFQLIPLIFELGLVLDLDLKILHCLFQLIRQPCH